MAELKPCPFCGSEDITAIVDYINKRFVIYCANADETCPAEMNLYFSDAGLGKGDFIDFTEMKTIMQQMVQRQLQLERRYHGNCMLMVLRQHQTENIKETI